METIKNNLFTCFGLNNKISKIEIDGIETFTKIEDEIWSDSEGNILLDQINDIRYIKENGEEISKLLEGKGILVIEALKDKLLKVIIGKFECFYYNEEVPDALIKFDWAIEYDILNDKVGREYSRICQWIKNDTLAIIELAGWHETNHLRERIKSQGMREVIRLIPE